MIHTLTDRLRWAGKRVHDGVIAARRAILGLGGLGAIDAAVWINSLTWGLVITGVTLLLLQYLTENDTPRAAR